MSDNALAGGIAGIFARLASTPLDVIKIRFQLQEEFISIRNGSSKYTGVVQSLRMIIREEGINALWKGNVPGMTMYFLYGSIEFSISKQTNRILKETLGFKSSPILGFVGGCFGGASAGMVTYPLDVLRTRLVAQGQGNHKHYRTLVSAVKLMYLENGLRTFYKGLTPSILVIVPQAGLNFGFFEFFQTYIPISSVAGNSFICGCLAGMSSKTLVLPLDMVKKRLQIQGFEIARKPFGRVTRISGMLDAIKKIFKQEGLLGFYKGGLPEVLKTSLTTAVYFYAYDYMFKLLQGRRSLI